MKFINVLLILGIVWCFSAIAKDDEIKEVMWQTEYEQKVSAGFYALHSKNYEDVLPKLQEAAELG
jgi:hypothetical protein